MKSSLFLSLTGAGRTPPALPPPHPAAQPDM